MLTHPRGYARVAVANQRILRAAPLEHIRTQAITLINAPLCHDKHCCQRHDRIARLNNDGGVTNMLYIQASLASAPPQVENHVQSRPEVEHLPLPSSSKQVFSNRISSSIINKLNRYPWETTSRSRGGSSLSRHLRLKRKLAELTTRTSIQSYHHVGNSLDSNTLVLESKITLSCTCVTMTTQCLIFNDPANGAPFSKRPCFNS